MLSAVSRGGSFAASLRAMLSCHDQFYLAPQISQFTLHISPLVSRLTMEYKCEI